MIENIFVQVLRMSYLASLAIGWVLLARLLLRRAPRLVSYLLWGLVFIRLVCPVFMETDFSLLSLEPASFGSALLGEGLERYAPGQPGFGQEGQAAPATGLAEARGKRRGAEGRGTDSLGASGTDPQKSANGAAETGLLSLISRLWLLGLLAFLGWGIYSYWALKGALGKLSPYNRVEGTLPGDLNQPSGGPAVYVSGRVSSPFILGVFSPQIILPAGLSPLQVEGVLSHERVHLARLDPLWRLLGYGALSLHFFNPLVWLAYFLSGKDMERACDEKVVAQMDPDEKKNYARTLLNLATGQPALGLSPLSFGLGDTKGRVKNVLKPRKKSRLIFVLSGLILLGSACGLLSDPKSPGLEEAALAHMDQAAADLEESGVQIVDKKIVSLSRDWTLKGILEEDLGVHLLQYRLKPENIDEVPLAGGMQAEEGWLTEDTSMGKPLLVFSYPANEAHYQGLIWGSPTDPLSTIDVKVRKLLVKEATIEPVLDLPPYIMATFTMSTGETAKLFLSQPTRQAGGEAEDRIWQVIRWQDGNGHIYWPDPQVDMSLSDYSQSLQDRLANEGDEPWRLDPLKVALHFTNDKLGHQLTEKDLDLEVLEDRTGYQTFLEPSVSTYVGHIYDFEKSYDDLFHFDRVEWITLEDKDRMKELGLEEKDMPGGYYAHNPRIDNQAFQVREGTVYDFVALEEELSEGADRQIRTTDKAAFKEHLALSQDPDAGPRLYFEITTKEGWVTEIKEIFTN